MIVVDANVLLYAYDSTSPRHAAARTWLERVLSSDEEVRFGLLTLLAFLRIATNPTVYERPLAPSAAIGIVTSWLARSNVAIVAPTDRHWSIMSDAAEAGQARGPMLMDAHLAALAIEHGATLVSTDRDFTRFPGLRLRNPIGR